MSTKPCLLVCGTALAEGLTVREQIIHLLTEAAEIEHNLLCCYLYAAFSLKRATEGLGSREGAAVERWRANVLEVAIQEMGHLAIVNNLLVAMGGDPHFQRPNLPVPQGFHPARFDLGWSPSTDLRLIALFPWNGPKTTPSPPAQVLGIPMRGARIRASGSRRWARTMKPSASFTVRFAME